MPACAFTGNILREATNTLGNNFLEAMRHLDQGEADALLLLAYDAVREFEGIKDALVAPIALAA
jgi:hypothetical protein